MPVNTAKVANRRKVNLADPDAFRAEVDRLAASTLQGKAKTLGNWSLPQIFDHLAIGIEFSYKQPRFSPPLPLRVVGRVVKAVSYPTAVSMLMRPGFKLPPNAAALEPTGESSLDISAPRLRKAIEHLQNGDVPTFPNPILGSLTADQHAYFHLRHAEMHLSFVQAD